MTNENKNDIQNEIPNLEPILEQKEISEKTKKQMLAEEFLDAISRDQTSVEQKMRLAQMQDETISNIMANQDANLKNDSDFNEDKLKLIEEKKAKRQKFAEEFLIAISNSGTKEDRVMRVEAVAGILNKNTETPSDFKFETPKRFFNHPVDSLFSKEYPSADQAKQQTSQKISNDAREALRKHRYEEEFQRPDAFVNLPPTFGQSNHGAPVRPPEQFFNNYPRGAFGQPMHSQSMMQQHVPQQPYPRQWSERFEPSRPPATSFNDLYSNGFSGMNPPNSFNKYGEPVFPEGFASNYQPTSYAPSVDPVGNIFELFINNQKIPEVRVRVIKKMNGSIDKLNVYRATTNLSRQVSLKESDFKYIETSLFHTNLPVEGDNFSFMGEKSFFIFGVIINGVFTAVKFNPPEEEKLSIEENKEDFALLFNFLESEGGFESLGEMQQREIINKLRSAFFNIKIYVLSQCSLQSKF